jgi:hypothetical protein
MLYYWFLSDHQLKMKWWLFKIQNWNWNQPDLNVKELLINVRVSIVELNIILLKLDNSFESHWTIIGLSRLSQEHTSHTLWISPGIKPINRMRINYKKSIL